MTTAKRHQEGNPYQLIKDLERRIKAMETTPRTQVGATQTVAIATEETRVANTYGDLSTVGPTATVLAGVTGNVIVTVSCLFDVTFVAGNAGYMSFEVRDAANNLVAGWAASDTHSTEYHISNDSTDPVPSPPRSTTFCITGLTAFSVYTVKAKYRCNPAVAVGFLNRTLIVQAI